MRELFLLDREDQAWHNQAACATVDDPDAFMRDVAGSPLVCQRCPVIRECGEQADEQGETWGVWGGIDRGRRR